MFESNKNETNSTPLDHGGRSADASGRPAKRRCGQCEKEAHYAFCDNIIKQYAIGDDGEVDWDKGMVVQNDDEPEFLCEECWSEIGKYELWEIFAPRNFAPFWEKFVERIRDGSWDRPKA